MREVLLDLRLLEALQLTLILGEMTVYLPSQVNRGLLASYDVSFIIRFLDWLDYNNNFLAMFYLV